MNELNFLEDGISLKVVEKNVEGGGGLRRVDHPASTGARPPGALRFKRPPHNARVCRLEPSPYTIN